MKTIPKYYGTERWEILLGGAWCALVQHAIGVEDHRKAFEADTGMALGALVNRSPITAMIDQATGHQEKVMAAWCDWVTRNMWGEEDKLNAATQTRPAEPLKP